MARRQPKKEITLMTVLAYESTNESRKLLNKYGKQDAKNIPDLEKKLADLYFSTDDKVQLEKDLAEIHPHKSWILKTLNPEEEKSKVIEEVKPLVIVETEKPEGKSCCSSCSMKCAKSSFYGDVDDEPKKTSVQPNVYEAMVGPLMILSLVGMTFFAISRTKN